MHLPILTFLQVVPVSACLQSKKGFKAGCQRKRCLLASSFSDSAPGMKWRRPVICGSVVADPGSVVKTKPESSGFAVSAWSITSHTEGLQTAFHKKRTLFNPVGSLPCIGYTFGGSNFKSSKPVQCVCVCARLSAHVCVCVCVPILKWHLQSRCIPLRLMTLGRPSAKQLCTTSSSNSWVQASNLFKNHRMMSFQLLLVADASLSALAKALSCTGSNEASTFAETLSIEMSNMQKESLLSAVRCSIRARRGHQATAPNFDCAMVCRTVPCCAVSVDRPVLRTHWNPRAAYGGTLQARQATSRHSEKRRQRPSASVEKALRLPRHLPRSHLWLKMIEIYIISL